MNYSFAQQPTRFGIASWRIPLAFLLLLALFLAVALANGVAPMIWAAVPFALIGFVLVAARFPEAFLVAAIFMPQWKATWPFSLSDASGYLTAVMLVGLALGVALVCLRIGLGTDNWTFESVFFKQRHALLLFLAFVAIMALSYLYTDASSYGGVKVTRVFFIGGLFLLSPLVLLRSEKAFQRFARLFVGFALITAVQMIVGVKRHTAADDTDITRIGAGWLMGMALFLILFYSVFDSRGWHKLCFALALPLLASGLVASAARGALVSFAAILPLAFFLGPRQRQRGATWVLILLGGCAFGAFLYLRASDPDKYNAKVNELVALSQGRSTGGSADKRFTFYRDTAQAIPEHLVLGNGVGSWSVFFYGNDFRAYPHNMVLEITFEEGLLGLAALAAFLLAVGYAAYRTYQLCGSQYMVLVILMLYELIVSMFSGDLDDNRLLWLWAGVVFAICRNAYLMRVQPVPFLRLSGAKAAPAGRYPRRRALEAKPGTVTSPASGV
jgi:O-antigen ligase